MILHYSLAILNTNDNALSLLFFANAPMSDHDTRAKNVNVLPTKKATACQVECPALTCSTKGPKDTR